MTDNRKDELMIEESVKDPWYALQNDNKIVWLEGLGDFDLRIVHCEDRAIFDFLIIEVFSETCKRSNNDERHTEYHSSNTELSQSMKHFSQISEEEMLEIESNIQQRHNNPDSVT